MNVRNYASVGDRRKAFEKELGISLQNMGLYSLDESDASTLHCENMIGAVQVPLGVAGPLRIVGVRTGQTQNYYIPLATTEGALVASVSRGCKAIFESGGATVDSLRVGATRGPVFRIKNLKNSAEFNTFLADYFVKLQELVKQTSSHITLTKYSSSNIGRQCYVRFVFDTKDAMGMNMATIATEKLAEFIEERTSAVCLSIAGNYDVDKKPSWLNGIEGRGWKVWAEVTLSSSVLSDVLKTSAKSLYDVWLSKCMMGSAMSGSMAFNGHFANIVAAIFLATGQDIAHTVEGSLGITTCEVIPARTSQNDNLYVSVYLPDLMVGTVGGGTGLATQKEALMMLGLFGGNDGKNSERLAEIIGGAVLAGEISLLASLSEGSLARAHKTLARGGKN